ncbi:MAG: hypothetical protein ACRD4B_10940, partial [Acidobacteriota bacterium]
MRRGVIQDDNAVTEALKASLAKCSPVSVAGNMVVASIPETKSFVRILDLPQMSDKEADEAVQ